MLARGGVRLAAGKDLLLRAGHLTGKDAVVAATGSPLQHQVISLLFSFLIFCLMNSNVSIYVSWYSSWFLGKFGIQTKSKFLKYDFNNSSKTITNKHNSSTFRGSTSLVKDVKVYD